MGWEVSTKIVNDVTKYRIWTTNCDGWITEWLTKEQVTKFFFWHRFRKFVEEFSKDSLTFPNGYMKKGSDSIRLGSDTEEFDKLIKNYSDDDNAIFVKFSEILNKHGIELKLSDNDGFGFNSKDK